MKRKLIDVADTIVGWIAEVIGRDVEASKTAAVSASSVSRAADTEDRIMVETAGKVVAEDRTSFYLRTSVFFVGETLDGQLESCFCVVPPTFEKNDLVVGFNKPSC